MPTTEHGVRQVERPDEGGGWRRLLASTPRPRLLHGGAPGRRWWLGMALIAAVGLAVRVGYVLALRHPVELAADAYHYHQGANLLVDGKGFIIPILYDLFGQVRQTAQHPPLYTAVLAIPSALGRRGVLDHQLWSCLVGTGTAVVVGLVGRRLAGPRAGLLTAGIAALYPNLWIYDGLVVSETLSLLLAALTLAAAYRLWDRRSPRCAVELGLACALAALTRGEALAYLPLVVVPFVAASRRGGDVRAGLRLALVAALAWVGVLGSWTAFNATRFDHPVVTGTGFGLAAVQGNCDDSYFGPNLGYYSLACIPEIPPPRGDESDGDLYFRQVALDYALDHQGRVPTVVAARIARTWGLYDPIRQIELDSFFEKRDFGVARAGLVVYYVLLAASVPGAVLLRRRGVPLSPLVALVATVTVTVALTFGQTRYRVSAELVPVLLAAVAADQGWRRVRT